MARIPDELIERIKREVPVADLCREYDIELHPKGKDLFAACPWHEDGDPSFSVTPGKNLWNCLGGCGGGDNIVFPICDRHCVPVQMYGRKITDGLRKGTPLHLYLEQPKRGLWNPEAVMAGGELILCEAILDALTFWCAGFRNVTCTFGANGINEDLWALLHDRRPRWIVMAQDNDKAGNDAVGKLAPRLAELGIGVKRLGLPPGVDVNAYACQSADAARALASLLEEAGR